MSSISIRIAIAVRLALEFSGGSLIYAPSPSISDRPLQRFSCGWLKDETSDQYAD
jgi:hypothetical protein